MNLSLKKSKSINLSSIGFCLKGQNRIFKMINMKGYNNIRKDCWNLLNSKLPESLHYHSIRHTESALKKCEEYLWYYKIKDDEARLLRLGVLMHDIGFTVSSENHEIEGVKIAKRLMLKHGFSDREIDLVSDLILATRIPQRPNDLLQKIICDVDLDYLGRKDFHEISELLYREILEKSEFIDRITWNKIQIDFLINHNYHTEFAQKNRQISKEQRIFELKEMVRQDQRKIV